MEKIMLPLGRRLKELRKKKENSNKRKWPGFLECTDRNYQKMGTERLTFPD